MTPNKEKKFKVLVIVLAAAACLFLAAFLFVFFKSGFNEKVLIKLGLRDEEYWTEARKVITSWDNTLQKLDYDADVVFFGDSLMKNSDFREYFPGLRIVNLGRNGDTITGMQERVSMIAAVKPENVFVYGGVNVLRDSNIDTCISDYAALLDMISEQVPDADIYVQSIIPVSKEIGDMYGIHPDTIKAYNAGLASEAEKRGMIFVDIYPLYDESGLLNMQYSEDGVHITDESYSLWAEEIADHLIQTEPEDVLYREEIEKEIQNLPDIWYLNDKNKSEVITDQINAGDITGNSDEDIEEIVISAWENMIRKMDIHADIVFIGDSITKNGDFQNYFPDKEIINIGLGGETIEGAVQRSSMISDLHPQKIFIMYGVNSLRDYNVNECIEQYGKLLDQIQKDNPDAKIYVQSVLPIVNWMQDYLPCSRITVKSFNLSIKAMAEERDMTFINLYKLYEKNGQLDSELSEDGVHPSIPHGYDAWAEALRPYIYE